MRVLVTGSTGFIGSRLVVRLVHEGHQVRGLGLALNAIEQQRCENLKRCGVHSFIADITDRETLKAALDGIDWVYHLAAAQNENGLTNSDVMRVNVAGTEALYDEAAKAGVSRFIYGSTVEVYGEPPCPVDEVSTTHPITIYQQTKLAAEAAIKQASTRIPITIVRIADTYGPGDRRLLLLFQMVERGMRVLLGNGRNLHHPIFIDDLLDGLILAAMSPTAANQIILLAGLEALSARQMIDAIATALKQKSPTFWVPLWPLSSIAWLLEYSLWPLGTDHPLNRERLNFFRKEFYVNSNKSKQLIDFDPKISFLEGSKRTCRWYQEHGLLNKVAE